MADTLDVERLRALQQDVEENPTAANVIIRNVEAGRYLSLLLDAAEERDRLREEHAMCQYASPHDPTGTRYGLLRQGYDKLRAQLDAVIAFVDVASDADTAETVQLRQAIVRKLRAALTPTAPRETEE